MTAHVLKAFYSRHGLRRLRKHYKQRAELKSADLVVLSYPKSGRTWLRAILSRLLQRRFKIPERLLLNGANYRDLSPGAPVISFTHDEAWGPLFTLASPEQFFAGRRVALLARHPSDVAVSLYHHYRSRGSEGKYKSLAHTSLDEFVRVQVPVVVEFLNRHLRHLHASSGLLVKYEDLHANTHQTLRKLLEFADLHFSDAEIGDAVQFASFDNLRKLEESSFFLGDRLRAADPDDPNSYKVRQGKVGGYRQALHAATSVEMERYIANHLSAAFGYGPMRGSPDTGHLSPS